MGYFERETVDYNPVTDKNYYGDMKYVETENDKREKYEKGKREDESVNISNYIDNIKSSTDFEAIRKAEEAIEKSTYLSSTEKLFWRRRLTTRIQSLENFEYRRSQESYENSKKLIEERKTREQALTSAKKRYKNLSLFRKIKYFKQRPSTIDVYQQTSEEIDELYRRR